MPERLHEKHSEQPSSEGERAVSFLRNFIRGSFVACCLTGPSLSFHAPHKEPPSIENQSEDRMELLLTETLDRLFTDVTVAEVLHVFTLSPTNFKKEHPSRYEDSVILAEALCLSPDRFTKTYDQFIARLCSNAQSQYFPLEDHTARTLFSKELVQEELSLLLKHNRNHEQAINALLAIRSKLQESNPRVAMHETP